MFQQAKDVLTSSTVLTYFDPTKPIKLAADASAYGTGAVIAHVLPDGSERPIAFASRTLSASEKKVRPEGGSCAHFRCEAISHVPVWSTFHAGYRLQVVAGNLEPDEGNSQSCGSPIAALGYSAGKLPLQY